MPSDAAKKAKDAKTDEEKEKAKEAQDKAEVKEKKVKEGTEKETKQEHKAKESTEKSDENEAKAKEEGTKKEKDEKEDGQGEGYPTPSMMIHWHVVVDDSCSTNTTITTYFHQDEFTNNRYKID